MFSRRKMQDDLSQKNTWKYDIFSSNAPKRWSFQKSLSWNMIFLSLEKWYFFAGKYDIFSLDGK